MDLSQFKEVLRQFGRNVVLESKSNLNKGNRNVSNALSNSIKYNIKELENSFIIQFIMEKYGSFLDKGVKGKNSGDSIAKPKYKFTNKMPPPNKLDKWVVRRGLAPRDAKGRFKPRAINTIGFRKSITFLIARAIYSRGIKPSMFFTKPFDMYFKGLKKDLERSLVKDIEIQLTRKNR